MTTITTTKLAKHKKHVVIDHQLFETHLPLNYVF